MILPEIVLKLFPPAKTLLLDQVRKQVDDQMLHDISMADYGCDADKALSALLPIRDRGEISPELGWHPLEVLELTCWRQIPVSEAGVPEEVQAIERAHLNRLFACSVLLLASCDPECSHENISLETILAIALESASFLGDSMNQAMAQFLSWQFSILGEGAEGPEFGFSPLTCAVGILLCAIQQQKNLSLDEATLGRLTDWVLSESHDGPIAGWANSPSSWQEYNPDDWVTPKKILIQFQKRIKSPDLRENIEICILMLS